MLNLSNVMLGTEDVKKMSDFYGKVLDKKPDMSEDDWSGYKIGDGFLTIGFHSEVHGKAKESQRIIINLETKDVKKEFERIKDLGAKVIAEPYEIEGAWIATFADPDGNYFQLMTPWEE